MKRFVVVYETVASCRRRLRHLEPQAAAEVASYLAQASDLQAYREEINEAFRAVGVEVSFFELSQLNDLLSCLQERPAETLLWTLTDGFRYYRGSYLSSVAKLLEVRTYGSPPATQLSCQDKFRCQALARSVGLRTPESCLLRNGQPLTPIIEAGQFFVKPNTLGAKIGIFGDSKTDDWQDVIELSQRVYRLYGDEVMVQNYLPGVDVRVSYMNLGSDQPPGVYRLTGAEAGEARGEFLTMKDNWTLSALTDKPKAFQPRMVGLECTETQADILAQVEALRAVVGLQDYFSFDFRLTPEGKAYFLEFEVCPAVTIHDFREYLREAHGLSLAEALVKSALHVCGLP